MSRIEEMIRELCPDGVEYCKFGETCKGDFYKLNP